MPWHLTRIQPVGSRNSVPSPFEGRRSIHHGRGTMRSASTAGLRLAGLLAMAVFVAHCGDSNVHIRTGGVNPSAGAFVGTTGEGGVIAIQVGSIDSISLQCGSNT